MYLTEAGKEHLIIVSQDRVFIDETTSKAPANRQLEIVAADLYSLNDCLAQRSQSVIVVDVTGSDMSLPWKVVEQILINMVSSPVIAVGSNIPGNVIANWAKAGLADYVDWPLDRDQFAKSLENAMRISSALQRMRQEYGSLVERSNSITSAEREVMDLVLQGVPNKSIANRLSVSQRTVESRRQKVYRKMHSAHLAELVRTIDRMHWLRLELSHPNYRFLAAFPSESTLNSASPI